MPFVRMKFALSLLHHVFQKILEDFVAKWMMEDIKHKINNLVVCKERQQLSDLINIWLNSLDAKSRYLECDL